MTGDELRATLRDLGMRQRELAARLGMTEEAISRYARGEVSRYTGETIPVPQYIAAYLCLLRQIRQIEKKSADAQIRA